jgi:hypothetical protein
VAARRSRQRAEPAGGTTALERGAGGRGEVDDDGRLEKAWRELEVEGDMRLEEARRELEVKGDGGWGRCGTVPHGGRGRRARGGGSGRQGARVYWKREEARRSQWPAGADDASQQYQQPVRASRGEASASGCTSLREFLHPILFL